MLHWIWGLVGSGGRRHPAEPRTAPDAFRGRPTVPELDDDELQAVVGGLERTYRDRLILQDPE